jgi:hypothetical protein
MYMRTKAEISIANIAKNTSTPILLLTAFMAINVILILGFQINVFLILTSLVSQLK